ncbi:MAG: response regulator [Elusimicrobia bacterium]|nr:response regulator [Elusimicrobiota bacterium]
MGLFDRKSKRILVADDNPDVCRVVRDILEIQGYQVSFAVDGLDVLEQIKKQKCDLLILDVHMPRMNGIEVLRVLRVSPEYKQLGVIMITSENMTGTINEAFELNAKEYILKPFSPQDLLSKVQKYFGSQKE